MGTIKNFQNDPYAQYLRKTSIAESSGNDNAKNPEPGQTATGRYQFIERTWNDISKRYNLGYTLDDRKDPVKAEKVMRIFTKENEDYLKPKLGRDLTEADRYLAHFLGAGGAGKFFETMQNNPNSSIASVMPENQLAVNKQVVYNKNGTLKTVSEMYKWANEKMGIKLPQETTQQETSQQETVELPQPKTAELSYLVDTSLFSNFTDETQQLQQINDQKQKEKQFILDLINKSQVEYVEPEAYMQEGGTWQQQQGGQFTEDKKWLEDWYKNRVIPNQDIQNLYEEDKPFYIDRVSKIPNVTSVGIIDDNPNITGRYNADTNELIITPNAQDSVYIHEANHYVNYFPSAMRTVHGEIVNQNIYKKTDEKLPSNLAEHYDYFKNPDEIHSRLMVLRRNMGVKPNEKVTKTKLMDFLKNYQGDDENILQLINLTDDTGLLEMLNYMANVDGKKTKQIQTVQDGGQIPISKDGVFASGDKPVVVPSSEISMRGVNYPILGTDNKGNSQMMMPGQEYQFPGDFVFELPMLQEGGDKADYDYVNYGTPEYKEAYEQGRFATVPNPLDEVVLTAKRGETPLDLRGIEEKIQLRENQLTPSKSKSDRSLEITKDSKMSEQELSEVLKEAKREEYVSPKKQQERAINNLIQEREKIYNSRSNDLEPLPEFDEVVDLTKLGSKEEITRVQKELKRLGYNLNPEGKFANDGVDGIIGKITTEAIKNHNSKQHRGIYSSIKTNKVGFLGDCKEEHCSEFGQNELFRNFKPNVPRRDWNELTGLHGDAWDIPNNIIKAGGSKIEDGKVSPGDVVSLYSAGRTYAADARAAGTDATHMGIVDQVNPDGSYYVLHNVHEGSKSTGYKGKEYRELVIGGNLIRKMEGNKASVFPVRGVYRPNYEAVKDFEKKNKYREDVAIKINPDKKEEFQALNQGNYLGESVEQKVPVFLQALNNQKTKNNIASKHGLTETEYQSLSKITLGVLAQESKLGTSDKAPIKQAAATTSRVVGVLAPSTKILNLTGKNIIKTDEVSKGAGQVKYRTNYGDSDLTEVGVNSNNFSKDENIPVVVLDIIAKHYRELKQKGETSELAMYKAVEKYNRGSNTKYADEKDSDYVNKVINYAELFEVEDNQGNKYNTITDKLLLEKNVAKKKALAKT